MGACASTQAASDAETGHKATANGQAPQQPLPPPETPGATTLAHVVAKQDAAGALRAGSTANGGPDHIASAPTSGADDSEAGKTAVAASSAVSIPQRTSAPVPPAPVGEPEPAQTPSAPHATANGSAAAPGPADSERTSDAAAPVDAQATALAAVLAGGAYRSNESGPARPACQQERLRTVGDIRDTLKQAHDPAIGVTKHPPSSDILLMCTPANLHTGSKSTSPSLL